MRKHVLTTLGLVALLVIGLGGAAAQDDGPVSIIFMHHSTGLGVIEQGGVREAFTALGYEFWDHGYNEEGLTDPAGEHLGVNWDVPGDNTDVNGWYETFQQPYTDPPSNTLSHMLEHDVIIFKSCFPNSDIYDEDMLTSYKDYFLAIRDVIDQHPDKIFIAWTTPPLVPASTMLENAARARRWAEYLTSPEFLEGHPNLFVFDFFNLMADEDGYLRAEYRPEDESDSHPNELANQTAGPILVAFVDEVFHNFVPGEPSLQPVIADLAPVTVTQTADTVEITTAAVMPGDMVADFEAGEESLGDWWTYADEDSTVESPALAEPGHSGQYGAQVNFDIDAGHYGGFGRDFDPAQDWSAADGLSFFWRADQPDVVVSIAVFVADPENPSDPTPFSTELTPPVDDWEQVTLAWDSFVKPDWVGDAGVDTFDPAKIARITFELGYWEKAQQGTLWLDDIQLMTAE